jgi:hypothetical protein
MFQAAAAGASHFQTRNQKPETRTAFFWFLVSGFWFLVCTISSVGGEASLAFNPPFPLVQILHRTEPNRTDFYDPASSSVTSLAKSISMKRKAVEGHPLRRF